MELDQLARQEEILVFDRFDEDIAWSVGSKLVGVCVHNATQGGGRHLTAISARR